MRWTRAALVGVLALAGAAGCESTADEAAATSQDTQQDALQDAQAALDASVTLAWGTGAGEVTRRLGAEESLPQGPSAVAVAGDGSTLLLDRLGGRILRVRRDGRTETFASVPEHAMDLAVGPDGAVVAFSPLQARAWVFTADGEPVGTLEVSRTLRELLHVELGPSKMVRARTGYQETFELGSPAAPLPLPVALASKKEGAVLLGDGRGVSVAAGGGSAELLVTRQASGDRRGSVVARWPLGPATAGRVVGSSGAVVCLRLEVVSSTPTIAVTRRALCVDATDGEALLETALDDPGMYLPHRELAVGAGQLVMIHPTDAGLGVQRWSLEGAVERLAGTEVPR